MDKVKQIIKDYGSNDEYLNIVEFSNLFNFSIPNNINHEKLYSLLEVIDHFSHVKRTEYTINLDYVPLKNLYDAFYSFDYDYTNYISIDELNQIQLKEFNMQKSSDELHDIIDKYKRDKKDSIQFID